MKYGNPPGSDRIYGDADWSGLSLGRECLGNMEHRVFGKYESWGAFSSLCKRTAHVNKKWKEILFSERQIHLRVNNWNNQIERVVMTLKQTSIVPGRNMPGVRWKVEGGMWSGGVPQLLLPKTDSTIRCHVFETPVFSFSGMEDLLHCNLSCFFNSICWQKSEFMHYTMSFCIYYFNFVSFYTNSLW